MRWLLLLVAGCSAERTQTVVHIVAGDQQVLGQIDHLALIIRDADAAISEYQVMSTALCGLSSPAGCVDLPADIVLFPGPSRPGDTVEVEAKGLLGDQPRIDSAARFHFAIAQSTSLTIALNSACLDRMPACAGDPDAPYCEADGSCGQPGGPSGPPPDLSMTDLAIVDLATPDLASPDLAITDLLMPDLAMPDLLMPDLTPCTAPAPAEAYVDALLGTDDGMHGSGGGVCAFKTVTFALMSTTTGAILHLAAGQTFSSGETFPLTLAGQTLSCGVGTTLDGSGPSGAVSQDTVVLSSKGSTIQGCTLGPGLPDPGCISPLVSYTAAHVTGSGTATTPITIDSCQATNSLYAMGVFVDDSQQGIVISNSTLVATNSVQVSSNVGAKILDNQLNPGCGGTTFSVRCAAGGSVTILGNTSSGAFTCSGSCYASGAPVGQQCP